VVWARVGRRPWWPCVVFGSWSETKYWGIPVQENVEEISDHQIIGVLLQSYECVVLDKRHFLIQDFDNFGAETVLHDTRSKPYFKKLRRAIADARRLIELARGPVTQLQNAQAEKNIKTSRFGQEQQLASTLQSSLGTTGGKVTPGSSAGSSTSEEVPLDKGRDLEYHFLSDEPTRKNNLNDDIPKESSSSNQNNQERTIVTAPTQVCVTKRSLGIIGQPKEKSPLSTEQASTTLFAVELQEKKECGNDTYHPKKPKVNNFMKVPQSSIPLSILRATAPALE